MAKHGWKGHDRIRACARVEQRQEETERTHTESNQGLESLRRNQIALTIIERHQRGPRYWNRKVK